MSQVQEVLDVEADVVPEGPLCSCEAPLSTDAVVRHLTHELRQPLSTIEAAAYYLQIITGETDPRVARQLERIQQMVTQMSCILCDAVHFVQAAPPNPVWLDFAEVLMREIEEHVSEDSLEIEWSDYEQTPLILIDPSHCRHMVQNVLLVFRMIARTEEPVLMSIESRGGKVSWRCTTRASDAICARVDDLFQPFTPHLPAGSGLALASVRRIAESHDGSAVFHLNGNNLTLEVLLPGL